MDILMTVSALVCGAALLYVVVMRTMRKRQQDALDAEASASMERVKSKAA